MAQKVAMLPLQYGYAEANRIRLMTLASTAVWNGHPSDDEHLGILALLLRGRNADDEAYSKNTARTRIIPH
jgi:hypothetical protein